MRSAVEQSPGAKSTLCYPGMCPAESNCCLTYCTKHGTLVGFLLAVEACATSQIATLPVLQRKDGAAIKRFTLATYSCGEK
jgi:hypothetical protein